MRTKKNIIAAGLMMTVVLSACQESPESSIVKNKNLDQMIEEAQNTEQGTAGVEEIAKNYDTYQTTINDESLKVSVNVDAQVDIPQTSQMSVMRVKQKTIDQELLDKVKNELVKDKKLYDARALSVKTRALIEAEIQSIRNELAQVPKEDQTYMEELQSRLDKRQEEYESAPEEIVFEDYPSDGRLHSVAEMYEQNPQDSFYEWEYSLNPKGEIYYGTSDGKDGTYTRLYAQNNESYGNCLRYESSKQVGVDLVSVAIDMGGGIGDGDGIIDLGKWKIGEENPADKLLTYVDGMDIEDYLVEIEGMPTTITHQEARGKAEELLNKLGFTDYQCCEGDLYGQAVDYMPDDQKKIGYRQVYIFKYLRTIDGVFVNNETASKLVDEWRGDDYVKKEWGGERIVVIVNDEGVVGFYYNTPLEIVETVVDKSSLKSFDEIKEIFEQMVTVANAPGDGSDEEHVTIDINRVILRYSRISEADSFDTGLLVPVWDFMGSVTHMYGEQEDSDRDTCVMTINAIDGSIIDRRLGY